MLLRSVSEMTYHIPSNERSFDLDGKEPVVHVSNRKHCAQHDVQDQFWYQAVRERVLRLKPYGVWGSGLGHGHTQPGSVLYKEHVGMCLKGLSVCFRYHVFQYYPTGSQCERSVVNACDEGLKPQKLSCGSMQQKIRMQSLENLMTNLVG